MEAREAPRADSPEPLSLFVAATRGSSSDEGDSSSNAAIRGGGDLSSNDGDNAEVSPAGGMGWDAEVRFSIWKSMRGISRNDESFAELARTVEGGSCAEGMLDCGRPSPCSRCGEQRTERETQRDTD